MKEDRTKSKRLYVLLAMTGLFLAISILFYPVFFQGKVIVPGDIVVTSDPFFWDRTNQDAPQYPQNPLLSDQVEQFYVYHKMAAASLTSDGHTPLWDPDIFTGQPLVADAQSSLFYPPNLLLRFFSPGTVATIRCFFNLLIAGIFTFLFCLELNISRKGAFFSAIAFTFSGPLIVWVGYPIANVLAFLPFIMWAGEKLIKHPNLVNTGILASGIGVSLLGGHPESNFHVWLVTSIYFIARIALDRRELLNKTRIVSLFLSAYVIGLFISGIQLLPFIDFMLQSSTFAQGGRSMAERGSNLFFSEEVWANLSTLITLVCPNFFGSPIDYNYVWPFSAVYQNYNEQAMYFGLIPLTLAVGAIFSKPRQRSFVIIAFLALFCVCIALRLPGFELFNHLPVFSMALNKRLRIPFTFLGAVMAGFGYDRFFRNKMSDLRERNSPLYAGLAVVIVTLFLFLAVNIIKLSPLASSLPSENLFYRFFYSVFSFTQVKTYITMVSALILIAGYYLCRKSAQMRNKFLVILIAATLIELCVLGWGYNPTSKESDDFPNVPAVQFLKEREQQPFRILPIDGIFHPNFYAAYDIESVSGYDLPVYKRYSDLFLAQGGAVDTRQNWDPYWPLIDFLNVKYVISGRYLQSDKFRPVYRSDYFMIYENLLALPRAFMVYDSEVVKDSTAMLERMVSGKHDFKRTVLLDEPLQAPVANSPDAKTENSVEFTKYSNDETVLSVSSNKPGFLVMSDLYTPDWHAQLDNRDVKIYRADYAYRAVYIPEGRHVVVFRYLPLSFVVGAVMTATGMLVVMLLWFFHLIGKTPGSISLI